LLDKYEFDVFVFSSDLGNEKIIRELYEPISQSIEFSPEKNFEQDILGFKILLTDFIPKEPFRTLENSLKFFESRSRSIKLMSNRATELGISYEWVVTSRFDLGQIDRYNGIRPHKVSEINFNPRLDNRFIYSSLWNQTNGGIADQWFYGSQRNIEILKTMPLESMKNFVNGSKYLQALQNGIPLSNAENDFSNEALLPVESRTSNLKRISLTSAIDNHLLHKYFFILKGLQEQLKFVGTVPSVAHVLYSHTDYADCWPIYFTQNERLFNVFSKNYIFLNKYDSRVPQHFTQIYYKDEHSYVDRLAGCLVQIEDKVIFFDHEDMVLYDIPNVAMLATYALMIKQNKIENWNRHKFDYIKLIRGGRFRSGKIHKSNVHFLSRVRRNSRWIFSIQPSFWSRQSMLYILDKNRGKTIWDFESSTQKYFRNWMIRCAVVIDSKNKRGSEHYESNVYPYIATAIVKGKWNFSEYEKELSPLLKEHGIDPHVRGKI
jgi:hypothetical protein